MSRRVRLPGADELFRPTSAPDPAPEPNNTGPNNTGPNNTASNNTASSNTAPNNTAPAESDRRGSGRVKHDEKMTVYVTADELLAIEQARLTLRRELGRSVDRGRLVRAAVALVLDDYEANGSDSALVQRLSGP